ncbi:MAG: UV DNA damage repair endonuclease UvsE, partial [Chloroflexi bacterium]|nr:UV DNA damage repair endonuclease UvsE [Chloroflexota bacterium]
MLPPIRTNTPLTLGASLMRLRDIIQYCGRYQIHMYRMHCNMAPQAHVENELPGIWRLYQGEATLLAELIRTHNFRLSFHPYSLVNLSTPDEDRAWRSFAYLEGQAFMLDMLELGPDAVIVLHVGGVYDEKNSACERFIRRYEMLEERVRRRIVLENDDRCFSAAEVLSINERCGVPLVFDWQHHQILNPQRIPW